MPPRPRVSEDKTARGASAGSGPRKAASGKRTATAKKAKTTAKPAKSDADKAKIVATMAKPSAKTAKGVVRKAKSDTGEAKAGVKTAKPVAKTAKAPAGDASRTVAEASARDLTSAASAPTALAPFEKTFRKLQEAHPDAHCELDHDNPFQLLVATVLSAQSTDVMVNQVTPALFARWPDAAALAATEPEEVEQVINRLGMYRQKAKNLVGLARGLVANHGGAVPRSLTELVALPGVGRKTANVVLGVAFGAPEGVVVDTHVQRITQRLGWSRETTPEKIEQDLMKLVPREQWDLVSHVLIFHGRRICAARKPACVSCPVNRECPSAFQAEQVGRKPPRVRDGSSRRGSARVARSATSRGGT